MKIISIKLNSFRRIEANLNSHFTAIIGRNGSGKSTVLDAVQIATGAFFLGLPNVRRKYITNDKITFVEATGYINDSGTFSWRQEITKCPKATSEKLPGIAQIKRIAATSAASLNNENRPMMPVIVSFGAKQLVGRPSARKGIKKNRVIIKDGYDHAINAPGDNASFTQWCYYYQEDLKNDLEFIGTYEAVIEAIEVAIPCLTNVSFDSFQLELVADFTPKGQRTNRLPHSLMSDGVKRMLAMVTDIAYRCIVLNGFKGKDTVKETSGVITIDHLELHLHPTWQRHVVADLKAAFPKIQFVVTTHSPFIVQSLESDELINLDAISDITPNEMKIDKVATKVMGVESVYSVEGEKKYQLAKNILGKINSGEEKDIVENEVNNVSDPTLRAFLEINKIAKGRKP